jgi:hypothetical protein
VRQLSYPYVPFRNYLSVIVSNMNVTVYAQS